jgi:hypothetical protein
LLGMEDRTRSVVAAARALSLPDVCTVPDLRDRLGLSPETIRSLLRSGALPGRKIAGRWYVARDALLAALRPDGGAALLRRPAAPRGLLSASTPELRRPNGPTPGPEGTDCID